jgi:two-component system cell cycle sensor histidine kinase/response regulator CckA
MKMDSNKILQKKLSELERRIEMIDRIPVGLVNLKENGKIVFSNTFFWKIVGAPEDSFGSDMLIYNLPVFSSGELSEHLNLLLKEDKEFDIESPQLINKNGQRLFLHCQGVVSMHREDAKPLYTLICADITDKKQLEQQIHLAQRLESIGKLAGGIAHDFNNILTVIQGSASFLLSNLSAGDSNYETAEQIYKSTERAEALTRQLLAFSRRQMLQPKILDINKLILSFKQKIDALVGPRIKIQLSLKDEGGNVKADPSQMEEVIVNLVINARDAMANGGRLIIETKNVILDENYIKRRPLVQPGPYVMLAISDTGVGMDENTQTRIFEPFFTTKEKGKGTGLGLATVYGTIKQSGGFIWVYSERGHGTTFKIYLPRVDEVTVHEVPHVATDQSLRGSETILVVDDESEVRLLVSEMLRFYGYNVMEAPNASNAFLIMEKYQDNVDLILTDIVMPEMNGFELVEKISPLYPKLKIVFMSGFTDKVTADHPHLDKEKNFVQKPFTANTLIQKIRDVLDTSKEV